MLQGIKELSATPQGYIKWRDKYEIDHYSKPYDTAMRPGLLELKRRCLLLEERSRPINTNTVIYSWDESGRGDLREIRLSRCEQPEQIKNAAWEICERYGLTRGVCDAAYIANIIGSEALPETAAQRLGQAYGVLTFVVADMAEIIRRHSNGK